jgi:hypothetical protein
MNDPRQLGAGTSGCTFRCWSGFARNSGGGRNDTSPPDTYSTSTMSAKLSHRCRALVGCW